MVRVFCLIPQDLEVSDGEHIKDVRVGTYHLLSDLAGITLLQYEYGHDDELEAAVSVACARMAKVIAEESFFIDPIDKAKRNGSIVKLFWEMSRIVPLTEEAPSPKGTMP
ncbi:hypothetical protein N6H14_27095 [Paenibacillus sp. CC-CFT747]|nr:hypothetical protein N6H14_27095 [Paenibacillus sp. CC-CFT747]